MLTSQNASLFRRLLALMLCGLLLVGAVPPVALAQTPDPTGPDSALTAETTPFSTPPSEPSAPTTPAETSAPTDPTEDSAPTTPTNPTETSAPTDPTVPTETSAPTVPTETQPETSAPTTPAETQAPTEDPLQTQLDAQLSALTPYLDKEAFTRQERQALNDALESVAKFCYDNGIPGLTPAQQTLWDQLSNAILTTPELAYVASVTRSGETEPYYFSVDSLDSLFFNVSSGDTITLLRDVYDQHLGQNHFIGSVILDLNGHTLDGELSTYGADITIKDGTFSGTLQNSTNLILDDVNLVGTLHCSNGTTTLQNGTTVTNIAIMEQSDTVTVVADATTAISGNISLESYSSNPNHDGDPGSLTLTLNTTNVTGSLQVIGESTYIYATKLAELELDAPEGFIWEGDTVLTALNDPVAKVGETPYTSLTEAIKKAVNGDTVTLLRNATGERLRINKSITVDLGGYTYTAQIESSDYAVSATYTPTAESTSVSTVTIRNGTIRVQGMSEAEALIYTYGSNLSLSGVKLDSTGCLYSLLCSWGSVKLADGTALSGTIMTRWSQTFLDFTGAALSDDVTLEIDSDNDYISAVKTPEQDVEVSTGFVWETDEADSLAHLKKIPVAQISYWNESDEEVVKKTYPSLRYAVNEANHGEKVTLLTDTTSENISISNQITVDLGSHAYVCNQEYGEMSLFDYGTAISVESIKATIQGGKISSPLLQTLVTAEDGTILTLSGTTITASSQQYTQYALSVINSTTYIHGCTLKGNIRISGTSAQVHIYGNTVLNGMFEVDPGLENLVITKPADLELAAPAGYTWETIDDEPAREVAVPAEAVARFGTTDYPTLAEAVAAANAAEGGTVTLLVSTVGGFLAPEYPITLDLGGNTYLVQESEDDSTNTAITLPSGSTIQNGTITPCESSSIHTLVDAQGSLTLSNVDLIAAHSAFNVLNCHRGTIQLLNGCTLVGNGEGGALYLDYTGHGAYGDILNVKASSVTINGGISLRKSLSKEDKDDSDEENQENPYDPTPNDLILDLRGADLTQATLDVDGQYTIIANSTILKDAQSPLASPSGFYWKDDIQLFPVDSISMDEAIAVGDGDPNDPTKGVYYDNLEEAIQYSSHVRLLKDITLESPMYDDNSAYELYDLYITKNVTLDLGGYTLNGSLFIKSGTSTIENGKIVSRSDGDSVYSPLTLSGGNAVINNLTLAGGSSGYGIEVQGDQRNPSRLTVDADTTINASYAGIYAHSRVDSVLPYHNTITVNGGTITAQNGIVTGDAPEVGRSPEGDSNVFFNGGTINASIAGIRHASDGSLSVSGGTIISDDSGIVVSDDNSQTANLTSYSISVSGGQITGSSGISYNSVKPLTISGGAISGDYGVQLDSSQLTVTGGTISGTTAAILASAYLSPATLRLNGGTVTGPTAIQTDSEESQGITLEILSGAIDGPISLDDADLSTTQVWKSRTHTLAAPGGFTSPASTAWYDPLTGDLLQLVLQEEDGNLVLSDGSQVPATPLKVTVTWKDGGNSGNTRPQAQTLTLTMPAKARAATAQNLSYQITGGSTDDEWTLPENDFYTPKDVLYLILSATAQVPQGYTSTISVTEDGIFITNTLGAPPSGDTIIGYETKSYSYYIKHTRTKYSYRESGGAYYGYYGGGAGGSGGSGGSGGLLQTGQLTWPIPILGALGTLTLAAGLLLLRKKRDHETP